MTTSISSREFAAALSAWPAPRQWMRVGARLEWQGWSLKHTGPALVLLSGERVFAVWDLSGLPEDWPETLRAMQPHAAESDFRQAVAAPGLLEGHAHLFLAPNASNVETDLTKLHARARLHAEMAARCGVTWLRDCGDPHGLNLRVRDELQQNDAVAPQIRACGAAIHRKKRYGRQLGLAVAGDGELFAAVHARIAQGADDIKIMLSGIVDFDQGAVSGEPQFSVSALRDVVKLAREHGKGVVAHASGAAACAVAAAAGVTSIEHGYFVTRPTLELMRENGIVWLPTLAPVYVQWRDAERYGHSLQTRASLRRILDQHTEMIVAAARLGVRIAGGSDSGSPGVGHGRGALLECQLLAEAGLEREAAYAACSAPGAEALGVGGARDALTAGGLANFLLLPASPLEDLGALAHPLGVVTRGQPQFELRIADLTATADARR